jgi:hypothetical protein
VTFKVIDRYELGLTNMEYFGYGLGLTNMEYFGIRSSIKKLSAHSNYYLFFMEPTIFICLVYSFANSLTFFWEQIRPASLINNYDAI